MRFLRKKSLNDRLAQKFDSLKINDTICFLAPDGNVCRLDSMPEPYNAVLVEYADNLDAAPKGIFGEDGDLFYMDERFKAMLHEIEM